MRGSRRVTVLPHNLLNLWDEREFPEQRGRTMSMQYENHAGKYSKYGYTRAKPRSKSEQQEQIEAKNSKPPSDWEWSAEQGDYHRQEFVNGE
jgi:hypothetical protein